MAEKLNHEPKRITVRDLYPDLTEEELVQAEENLRKYTQLALEIVRDLRKKSHQS